MTKFTWWTEALAFLCEHFPKAFFENPADVKPLKIHIEDDVFVAIGRKGFRTENIIEHAVYEYTNSENYLYRLHRGAVRIDLDGEPAGVVTVEEVERAKKLLWGDRSC